MNVVVTITLGLINHRPNWQMSIAPSLLTNIAPGEVRAVSLTIQPSSWAGLAGWTWSTNITETVLLPHQSITVTLMITPPCT